jgi:hypothetical protein
MISQGVTKGGTVNVGIKNGEFTFDVKKKKRGEGSLILSDIELKK